jgi:hypothetical protein
MYYEKQYNSKPDSNETKKIQKLLHKTEIDIKELAFGLSHGATFKPALLNGTKSVDWIQQQLFALDFDHDTTIQKELDRCKEYNILPCFGYTSFRHSEQEHHFRLIFCTDTVITDRQQRDNLQKTLIAIFHSDKVTYDCTRLFYGGKSLICNSYDNRINAKQVIDKYYKEGPTLGSAIVTPKSCKKKLKIYSNTESINRNIEAIKHLDVDMMGELLKSTPNKEYILLSGATSSDTTIELHSQDELFKFINAIDLSEYLGVEYGEKFSCILPEHEDNSPSACIWTAKDGTQIYKCFGCGHAFTIISLTEKLAQCSRSKAIEFIKAVYGITLYESDWTRQWKQKLIDYANYLDSKELEITFPELSTLIRTRKCHMKSILLYFSTLINEDMQINGNPFFFSSYDKLMQVCGIKPNRRIVLSQSLVLFSLLNMINKMQVKAIPEKELHKAQQIAIACGHKKLTGFYSFNEYGVMSFSNSEEIAKTLKKNHVTLKGLSREYILRTFGVEVANKVYPQYKFENSKGTSEKSDNATLKLINKLCNIINEQGYCLESDIRGKGQTELQWKRSIQQILSVGKFQKVRLNKKIKAQYNVVCNGYPFIIVNR